MERLQQFRPDLEREIPKTEGKEKQERRSEVIELLQKDYTQNLKKGLLDVIKHRGKFDLPRFVLSTLDTSDEALEALNFSDEKIAQFKNLTTEKEKLQMLSQVKEYKGSISGLLTYEKAMKRVLKDEKSDINDMIAKTILLEMQENPALKARISNAYKKGTMLSYELSAIIKDWLKDAVDIGDGIEIEKALSSSVVTNATIKSIEDIPGFSGLFASASLMEHMKTYDEKTVMEKYAGSEHIALPKHIHEYGLIVNKQKQFNDEMAHLNADLEKLGYSNAQSELFKGRENILNEKIRKAGIFKNAGIRISNTKIKKNKIFLGGKEINFESLNNEVEDTHKKIIKELITQFRREILEGNLELKDAKSTIEMLYNREINGKKIVENLEQEFDAFGLPESNSPKNLYEGTLFFNKWYDKDDETKRQTRQLFKSKYEILNFFDIEAYSGALSNNDRKNLDLASLEYSFMDDETQKDKARHELMKQLHQSIGKLVDQMNTEDNIREDEFLQADLLKAYELTLDVNQDILLSVDGHTDYGQLNDYLDADGIFDNLRKIYKSLGSSKYDIKPGSVEFERMIRQEMIRKRYIEDQGIETLDIFQDNSENIEKIKQFAKDLGIHYPQSFREASREIFTTLGMTEDQFPHVLESDNNIVLIFKQKEKPDLSNQYLIRLNESMSPERGQDYDQVKIYTEQELTDIIKQSNDEFFGDESDNFVFIEDGALHIAIEDEDDDNTSITPGIIRKKCNNLLKDNNIDFEIKDYKISYLAKTYSLSVSSSYVASEIREILQLHKLPEVEKNSIDIVNATIVPEEKQGDYAFIQQQFDRLNEYRKKIIESALDVKNINVTGLKPKDVRQKLKLTVDLLDELATYNINGVSYNDLISKETINKKVKEIIEKELAPDPNQMLKDVKKLIDENFDETTKKQFHEEIKLERLEYNDGEATIYYRYKKTVPELQHFKSGEERVNKIWTPLDDIIKQKYPAIEKIQSRLTFESKEETERFNKEKSVRRVIKALESQLSPEDFKNLKKDIDITHVASDDGKFDIFFDYKGGNSKNRKYFTAPDHTPLFDKLKKAIALEIQDAGNISFKRISTLNEADQSDIVRQRILHKIPGDQILEIKSTDITPKGARKKEYKYTVTLSDSPVPVDAYDLKKHLKEMFPGTKPDIVIEIQDDKKAASTNPSDTSKKTSTDKEPPKNKDTEEVFSDKNVNNTHRGRITVNLRKEIAQRMSQLKGIENSFTIEFNNNTIKISGTVANKNLDFSSKNNVKKQLQKVATNYLKNVVKMDETILKNLKLEYNITVSK